MSRVLLLAAALVAAFRDIYPRRCLTQRGFERLS